MPTNQLVELDRSLWQERLNQTIQERQSIIACGLGSWERDDIMDTLANSIPKNCRVIVLVDKKEPGGTIREEHLPKNSVVVTYNQENVGFSDVVRAAQNMGGDYLIISGLKHEDMPIFMAEVVPKFSGIIAALKVWVEDPLLKLMDGLVIEVVSRTKAANGINAIYSSLDKDRL